MKQKIYLSLCLSISLLTGCWQRSEPTTTVTPTPTPTPVVTPISPTTTVSTPPPVKTPTVIPTPKPSPPPIAVRPKPIYPLPIPVEIPKTKISSKTEPISKLKLPKDITQQITPVGIGAAKIGMSLKELKQKMGQGFEFPIKTGFIEGFDAIAVTKAGIVQYYIPYPAGTNFTDEDRIQHLMTDNPNYRTEKGVGPGTPIGQAASVYGSATLSLSKENESREFISFTKHPNGLAFRPKSVSTRTFAGEYPESNEEFLKTQKYDTKAAIGQITVSCDEDQCGKEPGGE
jgi:hypothetical protein